MGSIGQSETVDSRSTFKGVILNDYKAPQTATAPHFRGILAAGVPS